MSSADASAAGTSDTRRRDAEVIVVGAGPVGLMLAGELRRRDVDVLVLERCLQPLTQSRASTVHARTMEIFDQIDLLTVFGAVPNESRGHFGGLPLDVSGVDSPYPGLWKIPQPRIEQVLQDWAIGLGARLERAVEVIGVERPNRDDDDVEIITTDSERRYRAGYVVGCDGENSVVAAGADIQFAGHGADRELLIADVRGVAVRSRRFERTSAGLAVAARRPDGVTRLMVHRFGAAVSTWPGTPTFEQVADEWLAVTGEDVRAGEPIWLHAFGNQSLLAGRYRNGRILIAGDAAHRLLPSGGQALNLGLQDAVNLGWKLAAQVRGQAAEGLLDSYHSERQPVAARVLRNVDAQAQLLLGSAEVDAARRIFGELLMHSATEVHLAHMIAGLDVHYGTDSDPIVGRRLDPGRRVGDGIGPRIAELLRAGTGLVLSSDPDDRRRARGWPGRVEVLDADVPTLAAMESPATTQTVLLRPDGYVAWAGPAGSPGLQTALEQWFGQPAQPNPQNNEKGADVTNTVMTVSKSGNPEKAEQYDVIILGSGLAGSVSGAILARQGVKVMLIDAGSHPRFAIGESMTPQLVEWLHILRQRYDVPEIGNLLDIKKITEHIGPFHGRKQHFGFQRHEANKEPDPREATMFIIPKILTESSHLYRQDTDSYFFNVAARYGCTTRQNWRAVDLDFDEDGVTVSGQNGEVFRGKYLIDASGFRSPLAQKFNLREEPCRFKHHSRSLFTHYIGIKPFDEVSHHPASLRPPAQWHSGTLHHMIEKGWFWIIPFDNHKDSKNPLCSVGLTFDERVYPRPTDMSPEQEFNHYLDQYPAVKRQFAGATKVREWVSTDRLQYSSKESIGPRWCLMSHAAGFIDPLFSRGLSNTFEVMDALVSRILLAVKDDDWSVERFEYVGQLERGLLDFNDDLVSSAYIAFNHFRLWNAVFRVWASFITPGTLRLTRSRVNSILSDGADGPFKELEHTQYPGLWWPETPDLKNIMDVTVEVCSKYDIGEMDGDDAADAIFAALNASDYVNPVFGWKDAEDMRFVYPTPAMMVKFMWWLNTGAPPAFRELGRTMVKGMVQSAVRGEKLL